MEAGSPERPGVARAATRNLVRALNFTAPGSVAVVETEGPTPGDGDALVTPSYVGLCGTDLELFAGTMPYFEEGTASFPIQPGHEVCGIVVKSPDSRLTPGVSVLIDPVVGCGQCAACAGGFETRCRDRRELGLRFGMPGGACELIAVPSRKLHLVPPGVSDREAVLVEPGVTALNAVNRLGDLTDRRALVIGAGTVGLVAAQLLMNRGAKTDVLVVEPAREGLIDQLGARPVRGFETAVYNVVVEAAGAPNAIRSALVAVAPGGTIAVAGVQSEQVDRFDVNEIVLKDVNVRGVLNGPGLYDAMLGELAAGSVDASALIEAEFDLADAESALAALSAQDRPAPKILLRVR
jgi:2-desacetyl-2-hydroxyethyl bacteriochlorophyllide A dehydrogenase